MSFSYAAGTSTPNLAGLVEVGSIRINDGTFQLLAAHGLLLGTASVRDGVTPSGSMDGGYPGVPRYNPRDILLEGQIRVPTVADLWGAFDLLNEAFNLEITAPRTLTVDTSGWANPRQIDVVPTDSVQIVSPADFSAHTISIREFSVHLIAPDPRLYDTTLQTVTVTTGTSLTNAGTASAPYIARFEGPQTGPITLTDPDGTTIQVGTVASGHWIEVNTRDPETGTLTAVDDTGASVVEQVTASRSTVVKPGTSSWSRTNGGGAGATKVKFRNAWT